MSSDGLQRTAMSESMAYVYDKIFQTSIEPKVKIILSEMKNIDARKDLEQSKRCLKRVYESIIEESYQVAEDQDTYRSSLDFLKKSFQHFYHSFCQEYSIERELLLEGGYTNTQGVFVKIHEVSPFKLTGIFYAVIGDSIGEKVFDYYSSVAELVRNLRNGEQHIEDERVKPVDLITGEKSRGNMFVLSSVFVITLHCYQELLDNWITAIGAPNKVITNGERLNKIRTDNENRNAQRSEHRNLDLKTVKNRSDT